MPNIVPKNNDEGRLGRLGRRWSELHTKIIQTDSVHLASGDISSPDSNQLYMDSNGVLYLGSNKVALQGDIDSLTSLLNAFFSENGENGVQTIISSFNADYDTLKELIDGLETLSGFATTSYVDGEVATLASSITNINGTITTLSSQISANTGSITSIKGSLSSFSLDSLSDVNIVSASLSSGQVLKYSGSEWSNEEDSNLALSGTIGAIQLRGSVGLTDANITLLDDGTGSSTTTNYLLSAGPNTGLSVGSASNPVQSIHSSTVSTDGLSISNVGISAASSDLIVQTSTDIKQTGNTSGLFTRVTALENAPPPASSLTNLSDVNLAAHTLTNAGALVYDSTSGKWEPSTVNIDTLLADVTAIKTVSGVPGGTSDEIQVCNSSQNGFDARGVALTANSNDVYLYAKNSSTRLNLGFGTTGLELENVDTGKVTFATGNSVTPASSLTATADTLSFNGGALASVSYVDSVAGSGVSVSGASNQFEVSDGSGDLTPIDLSASVTANGSLTSISPSVSSITDLGSSSSKFKNIYLAESGVFLGSNALSVNSGVLELDGSAIAFANQLNSKAENTTVTGVQSQVTANQGSITSLQSATSNNASSITNITVDVSANASSITSLLGRVSTNESDISTAANSITNLNSSVTALGSSITSINGSITDINGSLTSLGGSITDINGSLTSINGSITDINGSLTSINGSLTSINGSISSLGSSITNINGSITSLSGSITDIQGDITTLATSITDVKSSVSGFSTGTGLSSVGVYTANTAATFIKSATSLQNADNLLNDQLETVTSDLSSLQSTVTTIQSGTSNDVTALQDSISDTNTGAGLGSGGAYSANSSSNYIASSTSLKGADDDLDAAIAVNAASIDAIQATLSSNAFLGALSVDTNNSSALSFSGTTIALNDANVSAGTAGALADEVELSLTGDITASAITFTGPGNYSFTTQLSTALANTITNLQTGKQDSFTLANGITLSSGELSLESSFIRAQVSAGGDLGYNSSTGAFTLTTYKSSDFDTDFSSKTTNDLTEGTSNLYYTDARVESYLTTNSYATENYVGTQVANLVNSAPEALNTLDELAQALGDDANFSTTVTTSIGTKQTQLTVVDNGTLGSSIALTNTGSLTYVGPTNSAIIGIFSEGSNISIGTDGTISATGELDATVTSLANHTTNSLAEGTGSGANLYYTDARATAAARSAVSAGGDLSYNSSTGVFTITTYKTANFETDLAAKSTSDLSEGSNLYFTNARADARINLQTGSNLDLSSKDTDNVTEGTTNLYFTDNRADARVNLQTGSNLDLSSKDTGDLSEGSNLYYTEARTDARIALQTGSNLNLSSKDTGDLSEGSNLYYTNARTDARIALQVGSNLDLTSKDTDDINEGTSNLYYTDSRADARIALQVGSNLDLSSKDTGSLSEGSNLYYTNARTDARIALQIGSNLDLSSKDTDDISEGSTNKYYTDARAQAAAESAISVSDAGGLGSLTYLNGTITYTGPSDSDVRGKFSGNSDLSYDSSTGVFSVTTFKASDFNTSFAAKDTDDLAEGANLYYTNSRADARIALQVGSNLDLSSKSTTNLSEGTNLYHTNARARGAVSSNKVSGLGNIAYDSSTGVISYTGPSNGEIRALFSAGKNVTISNGEISFSVEVADLVHTGEVIETFDHGSVASSHSSVNDLGVVSSNNTLHSVDLGGLDNGSFI